jgi:drug/metabolite transporter (DMT)-like permease
VDTLTIVLMLCAAALHASWHGIVKSSGDQLTVLTGMSLIAALLAACGLPFVAIPPPALWPVLLVSTVLHSGYRFALAQAYRHGDLGQAYPLARGLVPIFAMGIGVAFLGDTLSNGQLGGVVIVSAAICWLATEAIRSVQGRLLLAAAGAGLTVAGYSVLDAYGVRHSENWMSYTVWLIVLDSGSFVVLMWFLKGAQLWRELSEARVRTTVSGILGVGSFAVLLWALGRGPVGVVAALRESSVLFAVLIGIAFYRERLALHRIAAAALIAAGIVVISAAR